MKYLATVDNQQFEIEITDSGEVWVNGEKRRVDLHNIDGLDLYSVLLDNSSYEVFAEQEAGQYQINVQGELFSVGVKDAIALGLTPAAPRASVPSGDVKITAPIPGVVIALHAQQGDKVRAGDVLVVLESMKMENEFKSPCDGIVREVKVRVDEAVDRGQVLLVIRSGEND